MINTYSKVFYCQGNLPTLTVTDSGCDELTKIRVACILTTVGDPAQQRKCNHVRII